MYVIDMIQYNLNTKRMHIGMHVCLYTCMQVYSTYTFSHIHILCTYRQQQLCLGLTFYADWAERRSCFSLGSPWTFSFCRGCNRRNNILDIPPYDACFCSLHMPMLCYLPMKPSQLNYSAARPDEVSHNAVAFGGLCRLEDVDSKTRIETERVRTEMAAGSFDFELLEPFPQLSELDSLGS